MTFVNLNNFLTTLLGKKEQLLTFTPLNNLKIPVCYLLKN